MSSVSESDSIIKIPKIKIVFNKSNENKENKEQIKNNKKKIKSDLEFLIENVKNFIDEKLIITSDIEDRIFTKELYEIFSIWYSEKTKIKQNSYTFGRAMKKNNIENIRRGNNIFFICIKYK